MKSAAEPKTAREHRTANTNKWEGEKSEGRMNGWNPFDKTGFPASLAESFLNTRIHKYGDPFTPVFRRGVTPRWHCWLVQQCLFFSLLSESQCGKQNTKLCAESGHRVDNERCTSLIAASRVTGTSRLDKISASFPAKCQDGTAAMAGCGPTYRIGTRADQFRFLLTEPSPGRDITFSVLTLEGSIPLLRAGG